jgi:hypothetical protein
LLDIKVLVIPKPVWAVGFALEQTLRDATLAVFSFKTASAYYSCLSIIKETRYAANFNSVAYKKNTILAR